ncbi:hypothetical protein M9Y10_012092 [Tritrichomonas musculus]|uniref:Uncharacterized protein n=1 Tax=Tritrichomonas musculus TaxID=1915356 RepID=A0ABR2IDA5_9EUKA
MIPKIISRGRKRKSIEKRDQKDSLIQKDKKADIIIKRKIQTLLTSDDRHEIAPGAIVDEDLLNHDKTTDWLFDGLMIKRKNEKDFRSFVDKKWFNQTEKIIELWKAYKPEKKITIDEIISNISEDKGEEEEINDLLENENERAEKSSKVHKKQPIKEYNVDGWESLDEEGKMILKEHFNELFN